MHLPERTRPNAGRSFEQNAPKIRWTLGEPSMMVRISRRDDRMI
jgi:hypothetical protein